MGHTTKVWLNLIGDDCYGTSSWNFCGRCHRAPTDADTTRMTIEIFGKWLRAGLIEPETYATLSHDAVTQYPHADRARLDELAAMAGRGELNRDELTERDNSIIMRAMLGIS